MTAAELKKFLKSHNMSQGDLCRLIYNSSDQSDRTIVSRWINKTTTVPRWLPQLLELYKKTQKS